MISPAQKCILLGEHHFVDVMWFDYGKNQPAAPEKIEFTDSRFQDVNERFLLYRVLPIEPRNRALQNGWFYLHIFSTVTFCGGI